MILSLFAQLQAALARIGELERRLDERQSPPKTPNNSSLPPSKGHKPNRSEKARREGPRSGSLGRKGGGRALTEEPDEVVITRPVRCRNCQVAFAGADHMLDARYDKIDLPQVGVWGATERKTYVRVVA